MNDLKTAKHDRLAALMLAAFVFALVMLYAEPNMFWGDDNSAYILEGIAIAEGKLPEQARVNSFIHPTPLDYEGDSLVYVWGYPLLLALVYKLVGFGVSVLPCYYIPSAFALGAFAGMWYLIMRKRCSRLVSSFTVLVISISPAVLDVASTLYSDTVYLMFQTLVFFILEYYPDISNKKAALLFGFFLGLAAFMTYETRLNGIAVVAAAFIIYLTKTGLPGKKSLMLWLCPVLCFAVLVFVFERLVFMPATSNLSDFSGVSSSYLHEYINSYIGMLSYALSGYNNQLIKYTHLLTLLFFVIWGVAKSFKRDTVYIFFVVFSFIGTLILPYSVSQGFRYIMPLYPFIIAFAAVGAEDILNGLLSGKKLRKLGTATAYIFVAVNLFFAAANIPAPKLPSVLDGSYTAKSDSPYSEGSLAAYAYIRENTPEDCVIRFFKPRMLYLNTGRLSFKLDNKLHEADAADYMLVSFGAEYECYNIYGSELPQEVYSNGEYTLFKLR